ncbi:Por secretion system C-terminal sorting domain-containing protein [Algoriella xinjiangensis]|uniref:Por secretion system C-terminal sorting domain-containing protein n=1 Tax=Algoriella xinjiangensis TaxID=684065 RepID=A0A1I4SMY7_9FLAO|nr:T9SS type A sorting domain-containing protein [Algoriella xinjiangensis]SFM65878.1 Por secretion system C-terminal sorting domain-containing protein [Algoriella xinjiangensis]VDH16207.1 Por secretion system C-terminal sorting domain [Algoriella xinjiangensis]
MKKFYSLVAVAAFSTLSFAQGSESFEKQSVLTTSYADGSFAGETAGVNVSFVQSRNEGLGTPDDSSIQNSKGIMLRRSDEPSSVEFTIPNGVGEFTFSYRKAFTGGSIRTIAVYVDGVQVNAIAPFGEGSGAQTTVFTSTTSVKKAGAVKVKISYAGGTVAGNKQFTVDNVIWTANSLGLDDLNASKAVFSTIWNNDALFSVKEKSTVEVYNMNGQLVKSFEVNGVQNVNVSSLTKGTYVVKTTTNGKTATQKVVKK